MRTDGKPVTIEELEYGLAADEGRPGDRTPPQDLDAERSVLGGMMISKDAIADVVEQLRGPDFYRPAHEVVYEAILDLYGRGEPADAVTVADELTKRGELGRVGGAPYLHTLIASVPTAANAGYYARIVRERAVLRRLVEAGTRIVQLGYGSDGGDVDDLVNTAQSEVYAVTERRASEDYLPLSVLIPDTLDEVEAVAGRGGGLHGVPTGFADLDRLTNGLHPGQMIVLAARPAIGKALALDTPLPTPTGWTTMGEVAVGDKLLTADGVPTRVVAATEVLTGRPCYQVTFDDGSQIVADEQHQWLTTTRAERRVHVAGAVRTTAELAATVRCQTADARANHSVAVALPLQLPDADLLLHPYLLGVWLGDGSSADARFTTADPEIVARIEGLGYDVPPSDSVRSGPARLYRLRLPVEPIAERECEVCGRSFVPQLSQVRTCGRSCGGQVAARPVTPTCPDCGMPTSGHRRCQDCHDRYGTVQGRLRTLGVLGDKHIPTAYLRASEPQRRALLAGLLDTDGTVNPTGSPQITLTDARLAGDVRELVHSLGYRTGWSTKTVRGRTAATSTAYTLTFTTDDDVFWLERKRLTHKQRRRQSTPRLYQRMVVSVEPVGSVPVRCVEVADPSHLYLVGPTMIPTHNSTLGIDIARSAAIKNGQTAVVFSLEMSRNEITMRLLAAEARVHLQKLRTGQMGDDDWKRVAEACGRVSEAPLFIDDSPNMSLMEIRAKCRRLKQRHDLKLVVIDYLQLMTSGKRVESRQQEVSEFSRALKLLAKELEVPLIAISQLNRGPEQRQDKKPQMSDLRESGCLVADTRVLRADTGATTTLGELYALGARDVPVWALDERLGYVRRDLTHVFPTGVRPVFRLTTASGKQVVATANHPFLTAEGWRPLDTLTAGTRIGVPRHVPAPGLVTEWDERRVVLLAHLLGGGAYGLGQPVRYLTCDPDCAAVVDHAAGVLDARAVAHGSPGSRALVVHVERRDTTTRDQVADWLDDLGLLRVGATGRFVPEAVASLPKAHVATFLRHLWSAAGSVVVHRHGRGGVIGYRSGSRRMLDDVAALLLRFGIGTRIVSSGGLHSASLATAARLEIVGRDDQRRFLQEIGVVGAAERTAERLLGVVRAQQAEGTSARAADGPVWAQVRAVLDRVPSQPQRPALSGALPQVAAHRETGRVSLRDAVVRQRDGRGRTVEPLSSWTERLPQSPDGTPPLGMSLAGPGRLAAPAGGTPPEASARAALAEIAHLLDAADLELDAVNDITWDPVVSVEPLGERPVYDATILGTHNFVADGIAVHNSIEQDADMVILLHREDAYERESPRAGEADLIVAKHRNGPTDTITVAFQGHYSRFVDMQA